MLYEVITLAIPVADGGMLLGTWQEVYLFEHRRRGHCRTVIFRNNFV